MLAWPEAGSGSAGVPLIFVEYSFDVALVLIRDLYEIRIPSWGFLGFWESLIVRSDA
jgi:hypothetical protein